MSSSWKRMLLMLLRSCPKLSNCRMSITSLKAVGMLRTKGAWSPFEIALLISELPKSSPIPYHFMSGVPFALRSVSGICRKSSEQSSKFRCMKCKRCISSFTCSHCPVNAGILRSRLLLLGVLFLFPGRCLLHVFLLSLSCVRVRVCDPSSLSFERDCLLTHTHTVLLASSHRCPLA